MKLNFKILPLLTIFLAIPSFAQDDQDYVPVTMKGILIAVGDPAQQVVKQMNHESRAATKEEAAQIQSEFSVAPDVSVVAVGFHYQVTEPQTQREIEGVIFVEIANPPTTDVLTGLSRASSSKLKKREMQNDGFSMSDLYLTSLAFNGQQSFSSPDGPQSSVIQNSMTTAQISGFPEGLGLSDEYLNLYRHQKTEDGFSASTFTHAPVCSNDPTNLIGTFSKDQSALFDGADEAVLSKYFGTSLTSPESLAKKLIANVSSFEKLNQKYEELSGEESQVSKRLNQDLRESSVSVSAEWLNPILTEFMNKTSKISFGELEKLLSRASKEVGLGAVDFHFRETNRGAPPALSTMDFDVTKSGISKLTSDQWAAKGKTLFDQIQTDLTKSKLAVNLNLGPDFTKKLIAEFVSDGMSLEARQKEGAMLRRKQIELVARLKVMDEKISKKYYENWEHHHDFNQYVAYRYMHSSHDGTLNPDARAQRKSCEEFKIVH